jgi:hypothetical protein
MTAKERANVRKTISKERSRCKARLLEISAIERIYNPIVASYGKAIDSPEQQQVRVKRVMVKACPKTGCNAFLNEEFVCGVCETDVCKKCHEIKIGDHVCDEATIESIKAVHSEARPCPTCGTLISKIDGCDQMCKTTFSWRTGLVERGITHNPHYYEWMRRNGGLPRAPGDIPGNPGGCNGFPSLSDLLTANPKIAAAVRNARKQTGGIATLLDDPEYISYHIVTQYHQCLQHINAIHRQPILRPDNFELRVKFLLNEIDESAFKVKLQRIDKAYHKSVAKKHIYDMTYGAAGDILRNTMAGTSFVETNVQIDALFAYSNEALSRIEKAYSCIAEKYKIIERGT